MSDNSLLFNANYRVDDRNDLEPLCRSHLFERLRHQRFPSVLLPPTSDVDDVADFRDVRNATLSLFQKLPQEAWSRKGVASGNSVTVRALAYIIAGHVAHHIAIVQERYL